MDNTPHGQLVSTLIQNLEYLDNNTIIASINKIQDDIKKLQKTDLELHTQYKQYLITLKFFLFLKSYNHLTKYTLFTGRLDNPLLQTNVNNILQSIDSILDYFINIQNDPNFSNIKNLNAKFNLEMKNNIELLMKAFHSSRGGCCSKNKKSRKTKFKKSRKLKSRKKTT